MTLQKVETRSPADLPCIGATFKQGQLAHGYGKLWLGEIRNRSRVEGVASRLSEDTTLACFTIGLGQGRRWRSFEYES